MADQPTLARLAQGFGTTPDDLPPVVARLDDDRAALLADLLERAVERRGLQIEQAVSDGLTLVPRPLRRTVLKLLVR